MDTMNDTNPIETSSAEAAKELRHDVSTAGRRLRDQARETKDAVTESARTVAKDTRTLAQAGYREARENVRAQSTRANDAVHERLQDARERVSANPLPSVAWALGIGFVLGRFIFNGR